MEFARKCACFLFSLLVARTIALRGSLRRFSGTGGELAGRKDTSCLARRFWSELRSVHTYTSALISRRCK
uniref:Putative secreted protein n=1 Tax=Ixodes ricinus TaxID=34613 RepID=A0A6B0TX97_IXORI